MSRKKRLPIIDRLLLKTDINYVQQEFDSGVKNWERAKRPLCAAGGDIGAPRQRAKEEEKVQVRRVRSRCAKRTESESPVGSVKCARGPRGGRERGGAGSIDPGRRELRESYHPPPGFLARSTGTADTGHLLMYSYWRRWKIQKLNTGTGTGTGSGRSSPPSTTPVRPMPVARSPLPAARRSTYPAHQPHSNRLIWMSLAAEYSNPTCSDLILLPLHNDKFRK